jgi:hypothetical protein
MVALRTENIVCQQEIILYDVSWDTYMACPYCYLFTSPSINELYLKSISSIRIGLRATIEVSLFISLLSDMLRNGHWID